MILKQTVAPTVEPLLVQELKDHMRVETSEDADYVDMLITVARVHAEIITARAFITQTWTLTLDAFPEGDTEILMARPPLQSVTSIGYTDTNGDSQTFSDFQTDTKSEPGRIKPTYGNTWPATREILNAVTITFKAGYGDAAKDVPIDIKHAIKMFVAEWYERREHTTPAAQMNTVPLNAEYLLSPYRVFWF